MISEYIKLTKDGHWLTNEYDEEKSVWETIQIENNLPYYVQRKFEIEEGTTFGTFIRAISPYAEEFNILTGHFLVEHLEYYKNNPAPDLKEKEFDYLQVSHSATVEYYDQSEEARIKRNKKSKEMKINILHSDGTTEEKHFWDNMDIDLNKLGDMKSELCIQNSFDGINIKEDTHYALDFCLIPEIEHFPLKINSSYDLTWEDCDNPKRPIKKLVENLTYDFSLKEIIEIIFYELSFHGNPDGVIEMKQTLEERHEEMKVAVENRKKLEQQKNKIHEDLNKILNNPPK